MSVFKVGKSLMALHVYAGTVVIHPILDRSAQQKITEYLNVDPSKNL